MYIKIFLYYLLLLENFLPKIESLFYYDSDNFRFNELIKKTGEKLNLILLVSTECITLIFELESKSDDSDIC